MNDLRWDYLIQAHLDGTLTAEEQREFETTMLKSAAARTRFWELAEVHGLAADAIRIAWANGARQNRRIGAFPTRWYVVAATAAMLFLTLAVSNSFRGNAPAEALARFEQLQDCRWVAQTTEFQVGEVIRKSKRLELSSGHATILFDSGARVVLNGPCIFEIQTRNSGFLTLGKINARADTPESKGFTVNTRTSQVVDVGTEFVATAGTDGQSRVDVTSGEVLVHLDGVKNPQRLKVGDALSVEAGKAQVMVRIEKGDATPQFRFPSIEPPSNSDYADASHGRAVISMPRGQLPDDSGPLSVLLDGKGQSAPDAPRESMFFKNDTYGLLLIDLRSPIAISRINTYSWHQNIANSLRAVQRYTLYGYAGDEPPSVEEPLAESKWVLIARVNSDEFFNVVEQGDRPAQQACSISSARGVLGRYRYLLMDVKPTPAPRAKTLANTFFGEIDVYGAQ